MKMTWHDKLSSGIKHNNIITYLPMAIGKEKKKQKQKQSKTLTSNQVEHKEKERKVHKAFGGLGI